MLLQGAGINTNLTGMSAGTLPHGSSVRKLLPTLPATSTLQRNKTMAPPPSYDYFEEPTIYAQIDHYKTTTNTSASNSSSVSPFPPCISSPASQGTPSTVSPGTVQMYTLPSHPGGYHTLPHNHQTQNVPPHSSTSMMQMMANSQQQQTAICSAGSSSSSTSATAAGAASSYHHGTLPMPPSYQQHQQLHQQVHATSAPLGQILVSSNSSGLATAAVTSPTSSISGLSAVSKSYSREIVTVRTPLMYSQQESCV